MWDMPSLMEDVKQKTICRACHLPAVVVPAVFWCTCVHHKSASSQDLCTGTLPRPVVLRIHLHQRQLKLAPCQACGYPVQLKDMVRQRAAHDVDPPLSEAASYIKNEMSKEGYRHLLAVGMFPCSDMQMDWRSEQLLRPETSRQI